MIEREPLYAALFAKLSALPGFVTTSRTLKHWADVSASDQPALFQAQKNETPAQSTGSPAEWKLRLDLYLYAHSNDTGAPSQIMNPLLDAVCKLFEPENPITNRCTLGGLVHYARIAGTIETDEGALGDQAVCIVPVEICVTD